MPSYRYVNTIHSIAMWPHRKCSKSTKTFIFIFCSAFVCFVNKSNTRLPHVCARVLFIFVSSIHIIHFHRGNRSIASQRTKLKTAKKKPAKRVHTKQKYGTLFNTNQNGSNATMSIPDVMRLFYDIQI